MQITLFTDGACRGNPGPGGWAALYTLAGKPYEISGAERDTTNNRMELTAAIRGLAALPPDAEVVVVSDSEYVVKGMREWVQGWIRRGWRKADKKPVMNKELWIALLAEVEKRRVNWRWIEGHAGHPENERCDQLANEAIDAL
ncbi:MAG: ribonuclease HI [Planctomycetes bacterium]|nr:ribonuclease HI [Planctomycetota bacterium]